MDAGPAFTGGNGNDAFNVPVGAYLSALDSINGGGGNDTLNIYGVDAAGAAAAISIPSTATVASIETANITGASTVTADVSKWNGLTTLNIAKDVGNGSITAATTTAVSVAAHTGGTLSVTGGLSQAVTATGGNTTLSGAVGAVTLTQTSQGAANIAVDGGSNVSVTSSGITATGGTFAVGANKAATGTVFVNATLDGIVADGTATAIGVTGGSTITVNQTAVTAAGALVASTANSSVTVTQAAVNITGNAATTTVSVTQSSDIAAVASKTAGIRGVVSGAVTITDVNDGSATADTITAVTLNNYGASTIKSAALNTLNLSGTYASGKASGALALDRTTDDTTANATTLSLNLNGGNLGAITGTHAADFTTVNVNTSALTTVAGVTFAGATALNFTGAGLAVLTGNTLAKVTSITSGDGGVSLGTAIGTGVTFTGGKGADTVTVGATTKTITLGEGNNTATLTAAPATGGSVTAGSGTSDTLSMTEALAASPGAGFSTAVTGFEKLSLTTVTGSLTVDAAALGNFNDVTTTAATALTLTGLTTGATLTLTAATNDVTTTLDGAAVLSKTDTQNINLKASADTAFGTVTAAKVETFNIAMQDGAPSGAVNAVSLTLVAADAKVINVTGDGLLTLTNTNTGLTTVNASGIIDHAAATGGGLTWATGALASANTITGSAAGTNTIDLTNSVAAATTYVGGSGNDVIVVTNAKANSFTLGAGANSINTGGAAGTGNNTVTAGAGADTVKFTTGNNVVDLGDGANTFSATTGNNTYTGGTGVDTVTVTSGNNTISTGAGNDVISVGKGLNTITTGTGADAVTFSALTANGNTYSTITDAHATMTINLAAIDTVAWRDLATMSKVATLAGTAVFQDYLDAAASGLGATALTGNQATGTAGGAIVNYFNYGGDTYIVVDNSDATTYQNGADFVVKLSGIVDLSTATHATSIITLA